MSLLMDALKRAEEAKRGTGNGLPAQDPGAELSLQDSAPAAAASAAAGREVPSPRERPARAVDAPVPLAILDEDPAEPVRRGGAARPAAEPGPAEIGRERELAQNLFAAKQATPSHRPFYLGLGAATLAAGLAIAGYFWQALQAPSLIVTAAPAIRPPPPQTARIAPPTGQTAPPPAAEPVRPAAPTASSRAAAPRSAPATAAVAAPPAARAEPGPPPASPIRVGKAVARVEPGVTRAYQRLAAGETAAAAEEYRRVLAAEPRNGNALHGLAAVSLREGRPEEAELYYRRALEADPRDAAAQAALINLQQQGDPIQAETRLNLIVADQPDTPLAHFALGNLYARQGRWREAQQAYFRALTGDADNPDYHFNLAVSLDQLRQGGPALQYYRSALEAARRRPAGFDPQAVATRLRELQQ